MRSEAFLGRILTWRLGVFLAAAILAPVSLAHAARVYYVNQPENGLGSINAVKPDGTGHTNLHTTAVVTDLRGIAVDPAGARLFYAHADSDADPVSPARTQVSIRTLPAAGGTPAVLASLPDGTFIGDVEWDAVNGRVYFAQTGDDQLRRMNPDGSGLTTVLTTTGPGPYFFGLDLLANLAYWGIGTSPGDTNTAYSRGSLITGLVDPDFTLVTPSRTRDITIDNTGPEPRLYWCDRQNGTVYNRLVSGGIVSVSRAGLNAPHGLVLDLEAGKGYVADTGKRGSGSQPSAHRAVRFNLDGTGEIEFLSPIDSLAEPFDIAIDVTSASYDDWKTRFFALTSTSSAPADDPDNDGLSNVAEYAFFTHPERADAYRAAVAAVGRGFTFARRLRSDLTYRVEVSTDLQTWHWNGDSPGAVWTLETGTAPRDADSEWVNVGLAAVLAGEVKVFFRLRALQAPGSPIRLRKKGRSRF